MGENTHYKESGKFSPAGAVLMVLATAVCGGALFWLYLLFEGWCTIIYLNVFAAVAVSFALGFVGGKIVKAFKMRNTVVAVACAVVGFLLATYFKWALYDYNDLKKTISASAMRYIIRLRLMSFSATNQQATSLTMTLPPCRSRPFGSSLTLTSFSARTKAQLRRVFKSHTP